MGEVWHLRDPPLPKAAHLLRIVINGLGNGEDGLVEEDLGAFEGFPVVFGAFPAEEFVRVRRRRRWEKKQGKHEA